MDRSLFDLKKLKARTKTHVVRVHEVQYAPHGLWCFPRSLMVNLRVALIEGHLHGCRIPGNYPVFLYSNIKNTGRIAIFIDISDYLYIYIYLSKN